MKNLKIIGFSLFILACNAMMSIDDIEEPSTQEPIEKHIDVDFDEPIIDKKAKIKYTHTRYTVEPSPYAREEASEQNLAREKKLKKFRQQERAAKKIQTELRSYKENKDFTQKIEDFKRKRATTKLQRATRDFLKEKRIENFKKTISTFADQSYPKFKELICTSDYLTKTDWLYQFIEKIENKTIFARDKDGNINPNEFTPEFEKEISNPTDWLDNAITKYLPEFHDLVYEAFIDKAVEQIVKHHSSWTAAVSIPTPKGHGSFQEEGTPLFPKIYKPSDSKDNQLILGKIFGDVIDQNPKSIEQFNIQPTIIPLGTITDSDSHTIFEHFEIKLFGNKTFHKIVISHDLNDHDFNKSEAIMQKFKKIKSNLFLEYFNNLGLEISPEEAKAQLTLEDYFKPIGPWLDHGTGTPASSEKKWKLYISKLAKFENEQEKFLKDHINWASSARQTFYLGQLLFDKNLTAFDNLGGKEWLEKQPKDMQEYITKYIEEIKNSPKLR